MTEDTKPVERDSTRGALTRRKALGLGAIAVGGAAVAGLVEASSAEAATAAAGTTSLTAAAAQGSATISVVSTTGFVGGQTVWLDTGGQAESAVVKTVAATALKLTFTAALKSAHRTGVRVSIIPPVVTTPGNFKTVLTQLLSNAAYAGAVLTAPTKLTTDFPQLSTIELDTLRECAILSGADISAINKVRTASMAASGAGDPGMFTVDTVGPALAFSIGCCSCSCCCIKGIGFPS